VTNFETLSSDLGKSAMTTKKLITEVLFKFPVSLGHSPSHGCGSGFAWIRIILVIRIRIQVESWIRIRVKVKIQEL
jgi:hypothetical protein